MYGTPVVVLLKMWFTKPVFILLWVFILVSVFADFNDIYLLVNCYNNFKNNINTSRVLYFFYY